MRMNNTAGATAGSQRLQHHVVTSLSRRRHYRRQRHARQRDADDQRRREVQTYAGAISGTGRPDQERRRHPGSPAATAAIPARTTINGGIPVRRIAWPTAAATARSALRRGASNLVLNGGTLATSATATAPTACSRSAHGGALDRCLGHRRDRLHQHRAPSP